MPFCSLARPCRCLLYQYYIFPPSKKPKDKKTHSTTKTQHTTKRIQIARDRARLIEYTNTKQNSLIYIIYLHGCRGSASQSLPFSTHRKQVHIPLSLSLSLSLYCVFVLAKLMGKRWTLQGNDEPHWSKHKHVQQQPDGIHIHSSIIGNNNGDYVASCIQFFDERFDSSKGCDKIRERSHL